MQLLSGLGIIVVVIHSGLGEGEAGGAAVYQTSPKLKVVFSDSKRWSPGVAAP